MWFILGVLLGWLALRQPEWAERQVEMMTYKIKKMIDKRR